MPKKIDPEMERFQNDLLQSVREFKAGQYARVTHIAPTEASRARATIGLSQSEFARLMGVSVRTLQEWEQGRRQPTGAARRLLRVAVSAPGVLLALD